MGASLYITILYYLQQDEHEEQPQVLHFLFTGLPHAHFVSVCAEINSILSLPHFEQRIISLLQRLPQSLSTIVSTSVTPRTDTKLWVNALLYSFIVSKRSASLLLTEIVLVILITSSACAAPQRTTEKHASTIDFFNIRTPFWNDLI